MRQPKPWFRASKSAWYVELHAKKIRLGSHPDGAPPPKKTASGWNPPPAILDAFYKLMSSDPANLPTASPTPSGATGATGATGASGATGPTGKPTATPMIVFRRAVFACGAVVLYYLLFVSSYKVPIKPEQMEEMGLSKLEDAQVLVGFLTHAERATFRLLVKISGVDFSSAAPLRAES